MNKKQLVSVIVKETGFSKEKSIQTLNVILETVSESLAHREKVTFADFGTFYVTTRQPRKARNPVTGEVIKVPKKTVAKWRASKKIQDRVRA